MTNLKFPIKTQLELATVGIYSAERKNPLRQHPENINLLQGDYKEFQGVISDFGPEFSLRDKMAQIECVLCGIDEIKRDRVVVYDQGYLITDANIRITPKLVAKINQLKQQYDEAVPINRQDKVSLDQFLTSEYIQYAADEFSTKIIKEELSVSLTMYWDYEKKLAQQKQTENVVSYKKTHSRALPITAAGNAHEKLVNGINTLIETDLRNYKSFSDAINERSYGKALG